ncbi:protein BTN1 [Exaiptasia diaphana]|uniref:Battenin n=1 Tax=Exaiptasia diaphana TaxID=2652724 RepID=A0A913Y5I2_EXADI|nr:protein BTN1 [Exaiptasia diaphana]KXJ22641.1 Protein BTN1 [Exaiptasia diaphana]
MESEKKDESFSEKDKETDGDELNGQQTTNKDEEKANETTTEKPKKEKMRNIIAFYSFGALIYTVYSIIIAGAQDILAGTFIPTAAVLVTNVGPYFLVTMMAPYFIHHVPYSIRIVFIYLTFTAGLFTIVYAKEVYMKLVGICLTSLGAGTGEVSFFTLTAFYEQVTVSAYSAGTGTGFILGPLYYTGLTTWFCITPNRAMLIMAGSPLLYVICYVIMDKKHINESIEGDPVGDDEDSNSDAHLSWKEKFNTAYDILHLVVAIFVAYVCEYVTIQAVITTMAFPNAPFPPRVHYRYYIFIFLAGEFVARSYLALVSSLMPSLVPKLIVRRLWILSLILVVHFMFFLAAAWYRFIHDVWIVFTFIFTAGLAAGAAFANAFVIVSDSTAPSYKEFAMGFATIGMGAGTFLAGAIGLLLEPYLRVHCLGISDVPDYCFTRPFVGWNATAGKSC